MRERERAHRDCAIGRRRAQYMQDTLTFKYAPLYEHTHNENDNESQSETESNENRVCIKSALRIYVLVGIFQFSSHVNTCNTRGFLFECAMHVHCCLSVSHNCRSFFPAVLQSVKCYTEQKFVRRAKRNAAKTFPFVS